MKKCKLSDMQNERVVSLGCKRKQQMDKLPVCEGGVGCHRWMTERKEKKRWVEGGCTKCVSRQKLMTGKNKGKTEQRQMFPKNIFF